MNINLLKKEFGDYQTPEAFAEKVCLYIHEFLGVRPEIIIEPTAGIGNFIGESLKIFDSCKCVVGIDIKKEYCDICKEKFKDKRLIVECKNIFGYDLSRFKEYGDEILVLGNPPWVTNSEININLPEKSNFKNLSGTDAITGASNFDICEYIIIKLINNFHDKNAVIAMLCKTSVARNVLKELERTATKVEYFMMLKFDAGKVFGINASACLLVTKLNRDSHKGYVCEVSDFNDPKKVLGIIKAENGRLTSDKDGLRDFEGSCQYEWRQGIKHDCSRIMELEKTGSEKYLNKNNEQVRLEQTLVYPFLKSSSIKKAVICDGFRKYVIVTQKKTGEDTSYIKEVAPETWKYLTDNKSLFDLRKSLIYKGAPAFSMFGVGNYSYEKYKVGISGFYKEPLFCLIYNDIDIDHAVMLDDTCYYLSFKNFDEAYVCMLLLNCKAVRDFIYSISFQDAKRPFTKKVLQRLDLHKCVEQVSVDELKETETDLGLQPYITEILYNSFKTALNNV